MNQEINYTLSMEEFVNFLKGRTIVGEVEGFETPDGLGWGVELGTGSKVLFISQWDAPTPSEETSTTPSEETSTTSSEETTNKTSETESPTPSSSVPDFGKDEPADKASTTQADKASTTQADETSTTPSDKAYKDPIGRNAPCPCDSGRKYKKCCLNKISALRDAAKVLLAVPKKKFDFSEPETETEAPIIAKAKKPIIRVYEKPQHEHDGCTACKFLGTYYHFDRMICEYRMIDLYMCDTKDASSSHPNDNSCPTFLGRLGPGNGNYYYGHNFAHAEAHSVLRQAVARATMHGFFNKEDYPELEPQPYKPYIPLDGGFRSYKYGEVQPIMDVQPMIAADQIQAIIAAAHEAEPAPVLPPWAEPAPAPVDDGLAQAEENLTLEEIAMIYDDMDDAP